MDYVNLGITGMKVSPICLGCMTHGTPAAGSLLPGRRPWALREAESIPFPGQALRRSLIFFRTAGAVSIKLSNGEVASLPKPHSEPCTRRPFLGFS